MMIVMMMMKVMMMNKPLITLVVLSLSFLKFFILDHILDSLSIYYTKETTKCLLLVFML